MYMLASQMQPGEDPRLGAGGGLMDYLRRFMRPGNVIESIDNYRHGPVAPSGPARPYVTQTGRGMDSPLMRIANDEMEADYMPPIGAPVRPSAAPVPPPPPAVTSGGSPATSAIQAGANLADEQTGYDFSIPDIEPSIMKMGADIAAADENPSFINDLIKKIAGQSEVSGQDKWLAFARGAFGTAASKNNNFFGAVGEGGQQGLDAFQQAQSRAAKNAAQAASLGLTEMQRREQVRHNTATEGYRDRELKQRGEIATQQSKDLKEYRDALSGQGRWQLAGQTPEGFPMLYDARTGDEKVLGTKVSTLRGAGGTSVYQQKVALYRAAGFSDTEIADITAGKRKINASEAVQRATTAARNKAATITNPNEARTTYDQEYKRVFDLLTGTNAPTSDAGGGGGEAPKPPAGNGGGAAPARPAGIPAGAKFSPSQGKWWWQENGQWQSR